MDLDISNPKTRDEFIKTYSLLSSDKKSPDSLQDITTLIHEYSNLYNFAKEFNQYNPFCYDENGIFWLWDNKQKKYKMVDEVDILNLVKKSSYIITWNSKTKTEVLNALKQIGREAKPREVPLNYIQLKDYVIDIKTGNKFEAKPHRFYTHPIPHNLGVDMNCEVFDKLFGDWVGKDNIQILYEIIAYSMYAGYPLERIFCFLGSGANGKSCFLNILRNFIGEENTTSSKLHRLATGRFETNKLRNKLVCLMGETNFSNLTETDTIKSLVSGKDPISLEYKNKNGNVEYINYAKLIIATNNLPETNDKTIGWGRRWIIIDFPNQFNDKVDVMAQISEEDYEHLANKCIGVLMDLLKNRTFTNEGTIEERTQKYEDKSNPLGKFWNEEVVDDFEGYIFKHEFRTRLENWCKTNGFRKLNDMDISKFMKSKQIRVSQKSPEWYNSEKKPIWRTYEGIKWKE